METAWLGQRWDDLVDRLGVLIERAGAGHVLDAPVVRADAHDFPETWAPTAAALERLILRTLWLAHVDLDVAIDDLREGVAPSGKMLQRSAIAWTETADGIARFEVGEIGNDDVAGLISHEVGRAFAAWLADAAPYRDGPAEPPSTRDGSIAAVYLGLGVLAANSSTYNRTAGTLVGNLAMSEWEVVVTGGLAAAEIIYLLAVQAVLRGGEIAAHATLRRDLRERLHDAIAALGPHRDELATRLGVDLDAPRPALERDAAPPTVRDEDRPEPDRRRVNAGERTFRVGHSRALARGVLGLGLGFATLVAVMIVGDTVAGPHHGTIDFVPWGLVAIGAVIAPGVVGFVTGRRVRIDQCARCDAIVPAAAAACPRCGAAIAGRIKHRNLRLAAEEALDEGRGLDDL
jgi:hypothetical protein